MALLKLEDIAGFGSRGLLELPLASESGDMPLRELGGVSSSSGTGLRSGPSSKSVRTKLLPALDRFVSIRW